MSESLESVRRSGAPSHSFDYHLFTGTTAVVLLALSWGLQAPQLALAQTTCGATSTLQVEDQEGIETLKAAVNCSGGGEVTAVWSGALTLTDSILIGSGTSLSVIGEDDLAEAQGGEQTRLFEVSAGASLSLTEMIVSGGSAGDGGAILSNNGTVALNSCVFHGNNASAGNGGAVWVDAGTLTVSGGEFSDNNSSSYGGAIYALDAKLVVQDTVDGESTRFSGNRGIWGGAVYCRGKDSSTIASCSLSGAEFLSNIAINMLEINDESSCRGGAAAFRYASVNVEDCEFEANHAPTTGGSLHGDNNTDMTVTGCTFGNNTTGGDGAAISASSAVIGGGTVLRDNYADGNGGGVFGWNEAGSIVLNDVQCLNNSAGDNGGCLYVAGHAVINNNTVMLGNVADLGGCTYGDGGCEITITGGTFKRCQASDNGGFLFASDGAVVSITGGNITNNLADGRGAAIYCSGNSFGMGGSKVTITGGNFIDNQALEHGGAIAAWGGTTVVSVEGGSFINNTAKYYGGFIFLEEMASMNCSGATLRGNVAGDQGGAIYSRDAESVSSSCDLVGNESPQGAGAYLTHVSKGATLENVSVTDNVASGGSVLFVAQSSVILTRVTFESSIALQEDSSNRAVQLDEGSTLFGEGCTFVGWLGDTVIHSKNADNGSLVLNNCDFRGNSASMMVVSPYSDAEIRNAIVDETTLTNVAVENGSAMLVDNALNCSNAGACDPSGECVDSDLGVLCVCIDDDSPCLTDGGTLSLALETPPESVTYSPDEVSFELTVSAAEGGTTSAIWNLKYEVDDLDLEVTPSSGVLPPGDAVTVTVTGTPNKDDVGGNLTSIFTLPPVGSSSLSTSTSSSTATAKIEVQSTFYLCYAYQYDVPQNDDDDRCQQCAGIDDADGVDCEEPGATLASLPIKSGYWRSSKESVVVHECIYSGACEGATQVSSSDDYCSTGYEGPYCALCASGFGRSVGNICHSCEDTNSRFLIAAGALFFLVILLALALAIVFLVGGLDAVGSMSRSAVKTLHMGSHKARVFWSHTPGINSRRPTPREEPVRRETTREALDRSFAYDAGLGWDTGVHQGFVAAGRTTARATMPVPVSPPSAVSHGATPDVLVERNADVASAGYDPSAQSTAPLMEGNFDSAAGRMRHRGFGERIKRFWSRIPLDKLKILVVVWQILTVFPSITAVDFPPVYSRFLSWIDIFNLDLVRFFSASCMFPGVNFYQRLLVTTLAPIVLCGMLAVTFQMAERRAGIGSAGEVARKAAWSRHMAAGLLLTFLVFTSASTVIFKTFGCDTAAVEGESYLRADYSLSCTTTTHTVFKVYAGFMLLVYPIGIPLLYAFILWKNRHLLNPKLEAGARVEAERQAEVGGASVFSSEEGDIVCKDTSAANQGKKGLSQQEKEKLNKMVELRRTRPELVPSMFLWKDFGPDLYYYEVIECGRRILLTGVLIFIDPYTPTQAAAACIFAFASLLGFELLRPHLDPTDSWLYRLGCVVIFLSNFLALLIKVDAAGEGNGEAMGALLVAVNLMLVAAVIITSWFSTQQEVDDARDDENRYSLAMNMINADRVAAKRPAEKTKFWSSDASSTATASRFMNVADEKTERSSDRSRRRERISANTVEQMWEHDRERNARFR